MAGGGTSKLRLQILTFTEVGVRYLEEFSASPHLLLPVLCSSLRLVEAGQAPVVSLVQPPGLLHRKVLLTNLLEHVGQGHLTRRESSCRHH